VIDFALGASQPGTGRTIMMGGAGAPRPVVASNNASKYVILTSRPTTPSQVSVVLLNQIQCFTEDLNSKLKS
jgi:hypothetical protein